MKQSLRVAIENALRLLKPREASVIMRYFGLNGQKAMTLDEIGGEEKRTRELIRQLKKKALAKLRKRKALEILRDFRV